MPKLLVEIDLGDDMSARELMADMEDNKDWFPFGDNRVSIDRVLLETDPNDDDFFIFRMRGIIDEKDE